MFFTFLSCVFGLARVGCSALLGCFGLIGLAGFPGTLGLVSGLLVVWDFGFDSG